MDNRLLARIARNGGSKLLNLAVDRLFSQKAAASDAPVVAPRPKQSVTGKLAGVALTRFATRSVPGAIIVGGGILAKTLYDRRRAGKAAAPEAAPPKIKKAKKRGK